MKIGGAAEAAGITQRMIRHYEKIGLVRRAARRDSGYRDYGQRDVHTLRFIGRAREFGFSIDEIRRLLELWQDRSRASADVKALALARAAELRRKERELRAIRQSLEHLTASIRQMPKMSPDQYKAAVAGAPENYEEMMEGMTGAPEKHNTASKPHTHSDGHAHQHRR